MVKAWREEVNIPTYEVGVPEKNPIFLENRVYQGSSGVVYPYKVIEKISDSKTDHTYHAIFLENEYIKVMILPELGGRVQMAYDKIGKRHFIYYNQVIKPALVGLTGPWISGGIEFNWPQHHRPSTFMPVDSLIEENKDGSVTVWINEQERMFHQKGMAGFTLRPGHAYLEIKGTVYNRTEVPQTFLWWANPAVAVNDAYQSVFPPDINAVFDHGKRAVSSFPIATGTYYNMDYSAGVDISNYKNIFVPTSYMAVNSKYDFEGGYENDTKGGMLHIANHRVSPGKKQWTWGNGDFGKAWDRNLTDEDGPYIELMAGVFTENQPDFSWLMPYEEKSFTQYFMPYRELGIVKQASKDIILNVTQEDDSVTLKLFATSEQNISIVLESNSGKIIFSQNSIVSPKEIFTKVIKTDCPFKDLRLDIIRTTDSKEKHILHWEPEPEDIRPIPDPAEAALRPEDIKTVEQLYLTGLHLEQYRHATYNPLDYYEEGLKREPLDTRCNNAIGLWYLRRGRFDKAEPFFRTAVKVLQKRNPNPYWGEPLYNLGLCLRYLYLQENKENLLEEAYDWFYKSTWNSAWQDAGFFACAQISCLQERYDDALEEIDHSLIRNWHNHKARALKAFVLRMTGVKDVSERKAFLEESLRIDKFNFGVLFEQFLLTKEENENEGEKLLKELKGLLRKDSNNYYDLALDYWNIGAKDEYEFIRRTQQEECGSEEVSFPNRLEDIFLVKDDYKLGCLFYDKRQYDLSRKYWEKCAQEKPDFPAVHRCLALLYYNKSKETEKAVEEMEKAFRLDTNDARIFMELDQLYKTLQKSHSERLELFKSNMNLIEKRDDLVLEYITLLNLTEKYAEAKELLDNHIFHPWEGGEGKVPAQYVLSRVALAKNLLKSDNIDNISKAINLLEECLSYPHNLGEGKLYNAQENDIYYLLGKGFAHLAALDKDNKETLSDKARDCWEKGTKGPTTPAAALYYNDAKPDKIYYAGLCFLELYKQQENKSYLSNAKSLFNKLINFGKQHIFDNVKMDYFAVSLPDLQVWDGNLNTMNQIHCNFMLALGYSGMALADEGGEAMKARLLAADYLGKAASTDKNHLGIAEYKIISAS